MNSISESADAEPRARTDALRWRWPDRRIWWYALSFGLVASAPSFVSSLDLEGVGVTPRTVLAQLLGPQFTAHLVLTAWILATANRSDSRRRYLRIAAMVGVALMIDVLVSPWLLQTVLGLPNVLELAIAAKKVLAPPAVLAACTEFFSGALFATLAVAIGEFWRVRQQALAAMAEAASSGAAVRHRLLEARLAAMQAQVEPQFLFETLVDVEATYERDPQLAAQQLDRLIAFLRVALPGLRGNGQTSGSTLGNELALVDAYLDIVRARHAGQPKIRIEVGGSCRAERFYPMLLLPLVQRAARAGEGVARSLVIEVACSADFGIELSITGEFEGPAHSEPEIDGVRERLLELYDGHATLHFAGEGASGVRIALHVPSSSPASLAA